MATIQARTNGDGSTSYRAIIRKAGHRMTATFGTDEEARFWAHGIETRIDAKQVVTGGEVTLASSARVMLTKFLAEETPKKRGARSETQMLNALLDRFAVFDKTLADFGPRDIEAICAARLKGSDKYSPVSPSTVRRELGMLSGAFSHAIRKWEVKLSANPCANVDRPREAPHRRRRISDAERAEICAALDYVEGTRPTKRKQWVAWSFLLALETCMRRGEILGARWENYAAAECSLHLGTTKNGDARDVPISDGAAELLRVAGPGIKGAIVPVLESTFSNIWNRAKKGTTWEDVHFHDTRHESATQYSTCVNNVLELAAITGHKRLESLRIYVNPTAKHLAGMMNKRRAA